MIKVALPVLLTLGIGIFTNWKLERTKTTLNKDLENHKQLLAIITEKSKLDNQKMMHDFNLYRTKKHEIYPEMYKLLIAGHYDIARLLDDWSMPDFSHHSKEMLNSYLISRGLSEEEAQALLINRGVVNDPFELKFRIKMLDWNDTFHRFKYANEYYLRSQLYFSEEALRLVKSYLDISSAIIKDLVPYIHARSYQLDMEAYKELFSLNLEGNVAKIKEGINDLREQLKKELSIAEYEPEG
ncbi:hypothetical protein [Paenibacillus sp. UNC499MF]|uniref:hypothetical protein n=1 Tax=Paenibacillus sp. UNC499MF TaxID=1502751 RepID=UPI0011B0BE64|nr:hypothetical protein [Paenibacillus sp. UNC499MF]